MSQAPLLQVLTLAAGQEFPQVTALVEYDVHISPSTVVSHAVLEHGQLLADVQLAYAPGVELHKPVFWHVLVLLAGQELPQEARDMVLVEHVPPALV